MIRLKDLLKESIPQSGDTSGKPAVFMPDAKPDKVEFLTLDDIFKKVRDIVYYNDVVNDLLKGDDSWDVTKKVVEYAKYLKSNPNSVKNLPPIIVVDGKLNDGSHRISAIYLLQKLLDKDNNFWKNVKLQVQFWDGKNLKR